MKNYLKPALLAVFLTLPVTAHAATDEDLANLAGWQEDLDFIRSHSNDPNFVVRHCAREMEDDMETNRSAIIFGFSGVKIFLPAANHFRENTIMPWFHDCVRQARGE